VKLTKEEIDQLPEKVQTYINNLNLKFDALKEQLDAVLFRKFNRSSEELDVKQELLFDKEETLPEETKTETEETTEQIKSYTRKKPGRKPIDPSLPRKEIIHDIADEDKVCACGCALSKIGEETSEKVNIIPPQIWVERHIRPKYACKACEGSGDEDKKVFKIAPVEPAIIDKSIVTPGLLAFIIVNKFVDHLPYYRQEKKFERIGIYISRQDMSNWQRKAFEKLGPLISLLKKEVRSGPLIRMDETPVQVLNEEGRENTTKSYMWLSMGGTPGKECFVYDYRQTRAASYVREYLSEYSGFLQTDGYEGYVSALKDKPKIIHVTCFAHARRYFFDAVKSGKTGSADEGIKHIQKLYAIENNLRAKKLPDDVFLEERRKEAQPVLEQFKAWLDKKVTQVPPSVLIGKAVNYTLGQWGKLIRYLDCPYLTPDNNLAENAIRPFVLGRKNWLFSGSPEGAVSSCAFYSLIETAKYHKLNPHTYLMKVFEIAPFLDIKNEKDFEKLLPWNLKN
jgi:transposase